MSKKTFRGYFISLGLLIELATIPVFAQSRGELQFIRTNTSSNPRKTIEIKIDQDPNAYSYLWDDLNKVVIPSEEYHIDIPDSQFLDPSFDAPASEQAATNGVLPWGKMTIRVLIDGNDYVDHPIDFRDEDWAGLQSTYPGSDTYIQIIVSNQATSVTISHAGGGAAIDLSTAGVKIWTIWGKDDT